MVPDRESTPKSKNAPNDLQKVPEDAVPLLEVVFDLVGSSQLRRFGAVFPSRRTRSCRIKTGDPFQENRRPGADRRRIQISSQLTHFRRFCE